MAPEKQPLLGRLQTTIRKVTFLLSFDRNRWLLPSFLGLKWGQTGRLSFEEWPAGLIDIAHDQDCDAESTFTLSRSTSLATDRSSSTTPVREILRSTSLVYRSTTPVPEVVRSVSNASSSEDIDQKAEDFIANFYRQLRMERQISLELRYCRGNFGPDRTPSR